MAQTYFESGSLDEAKEYSLKAKKLATEIGDTRTPVYNDELLKEIEAAISGEVT
jgi:hypothetical protein